MPTRSITLAGRSWQVMPSGRVTQYDRKTSRIQLSIKALEIAEEKEAVANYGSSDSGASLGDILGEAFKARTEEKK